MRNNTNALVALPKMKLAGIFATKNRMRHCKLLRNNRRISPCFERINEEHNVPF
jgi:hypothetical protein